MRLAYRTEDLATNAKPHVILPFLRDQDNVQYLEVRGTIW